ncbi:MAG: amidohydrolase family protein [Chloroflexi bacterium]|nr:amidohydrolase family protein [Chloroflexota bacterium]
MEVVDAHQHIGDLADALGDFEAHETKQSVEEEAQGRVRALDAGGVDWAIIQPAHAYLKPDGIKDTMRINDGIAAYRRFAPTRFRMALGTVEPLHGERTMEEVDRCKRELKLDGLSWHHRLQGCYIDNKWMRPILRRMADLKMVPLIHTNAESKLEAPWRLQRLAYEFPEHTFIALDAFYSYEQSMEVLFIAERTPNILWDVGGPTGWAQVAAWIPKHGSEKFTFSAGISYAAMRKPGRSRLLDSILKSPGLTDDDKANILSRNVRKAFGIKGKK